MSHPLGFYRRLTGHPEDAIRWACLLEATAPKAGNVYPGQPFDGLAHIDFLVAAEIVAPRMGRSERRMSERMLGAVEESVSLANTNVNLGIVLLLGPLVAADEVLMLRHVARRTDEAWISAIAEALGEMDGVDGQNIYRAIDSAAAGGLGRVDQMDVHDNEGEVDIIEAMKLADSYDRIARQYACGFTDLIKNVLPVVRDSIGQRGDVLAGITCAQLKLLQLQPDTLIARKNDMDVAGDVQRRAQRVESEEHPSFTDFDNWLRSDGNKLNPGTTADLIAASLYVLLRTDPSQES